MMQQIYFVVPQNLDCSSSGQDLVSFCDHDVDINTCLVLNIENENDERQIIIKLHKQFTNPSADKFNTLLQDTEYWKIHFSDVLKDRYINIYINGDTYLKFKKTPLGLYQHVYGRNPNIPNIMTDIPAPLSNITTGKLQII